MENEFNHRARVSGIQSKNSEVKSVANHIVELESMIAELEHLRIVQADFNSLEVVLAKTKVRETLLRTYGADSPEYLDNLGAEIFSREFSRVGLTREDVQEAFLAALPEAIEKYRKLIRRWKASEGPLS